MKKGTIVKHKGQDVGVRENYLGEMFIDRNIYLNHPRMVKLIAQAKQILTNKQK